MVVFLVSGVQHHLKTRLFTQIFNVRDYLDAILFKKNYRILLLNTTINLHHSERCNLFIFNASPFGVRSIAKLAPALGMESAKTNSSQNLGYWVWINNIPSLSFTLLKTTKNALNKEKSFKICFANFAATIWSKKNFCATINARWCRVLFNYGHIKNDFPSIKNLQPR